MRRPILCVLPLQKGKVVAWMSCPVCVDSRCVNNHGQVESPMSIQTPVRPSKEAMEADLAGLHEIGALRHRSTALKGEIDELWKVATLIAKTSDALSRENQILRKKNAELTESASTVSRTEYAHRTPTGFVKEPAVLFETRSGAQALLRRGFTIVSRTVTEWEPVAPNVHNHGIDPSCKETRQPDGTLRGECMS